MLFLGIASLWKQAEAARQVERTLNSPELIAATDDGGNETKTGEGRKGRIKDAS